MRVQTLVRSVNEVNLHNFTAFHRNIMYKICGEKKQIFTAYLTFFIFFDFSSTRAAKRSSKKWASEFSVYVLCIQKQRIMIKVSIIRLFDKLSKIHFTRLCNRCVNMFNDMQGADLAIYFCATLCIAVYCVM